MLEKISNAIPVTGMESLAPVLASGMGPVTDYLNPTSPVVLLDPERLSLRAKNLVETNQEFLHAAWDAAIEAAAHR